MAAGLQALDPVADDHFGEPRPPLESGCNRTGAALGRERSRVPRRNPSAGRLVPF
jgi:hypothetical protein